MDGDVDAAPESAVEDGTDEDFEAGFGTAAAEGATATPAPQPEAVQDTPPEPLAAKAPADAPPEPKPEPAPKYVQITEAELQELRQGTAQMRQQLDKAFGQIGSLRQLSERAQAAIAERAQAATPPGQKVELSAEDFGELAQEYPELAKLTLNGLNKAMEKMRGTGSDPKALEDLVSQRLDTVRQESKTESTETLLNAVLPGWRKEVNKPEFAQWLQGQPKEVQDMKMSADPVVAAEMLRLYDRHQLRSLFQPPAAPPAAAPTPPPARPSARQRQLAAALPVRGEGVSPTPQSAEDDPFEAGYRSARS